MLENLPIWLILVIYALATYRICRLLIEDTITEPLRERFWKRFPPESSKLGYLLTCYHCLSVYVAFAAVLALLFAGIIGLAIALVLALSTCTGFLSTKM